MSILFKIVKIITINKFTKIMYVVNNYSGIYGTKTEKIIKLR